MLTFRNGAPGGVAQAEAYVAHLMELTLPADQMKLADYYARLDGTEATLATGMGSIPRPQRDMAPEVAEALGIDPARPLTRQELGNILGGLRADGEPVAGSQREVRSYKAAEEAEGEPAAKQRERSAWMDLCLSAPKHLSVAWFRAESEGERQSLLQAHRDAVDETLAYIEREVAVATFGHGRKATGEEAGRLGFIKVDHFTARPTLSITRPDPITGVSATEIYSVMAAGDPQIHTHTIVPNVLVTESGRILSIDTKRIAGRIHEFGAIYQGVLGAKLEALGVSTGLDPRTKMLRLSTIPEEVVQAFSKRTTQGEGAAEEYARQHGLVWGDMPTNQRVAMLKAALKERREGKGDDLANIASWNRQADAMGWKGGSVVTYGPPAPERSLEQRTREAGLTGLPELEDMLHRSAVILGTDVRLAAARGWIASGGIRDTGHVSLVTRAMVRNGVQQDGTWTELMFPRQERGRPERIRVTTGLHRDQEQELIALAKVAHTAPIGGVTPANRDAALAASPVKLNDEQRVALNVLAGPGAMQLAIGGSGAGKTTLLAPLVAAYRAEGRDVWGTATANRQANALREADIASNRTRALDPLLGMMRDRPQNFGPNSVIIVDELGQVGTRQLLRLMRQQRDLGFEVRLVGDDRQCQSIEAGPVIDLLRRAVGQDAIPEVLTTIRQQTERDRQIVGLWRAGKSVEALAMKREDGTAHLVPGGYAETVKAVAQQWRALVEANKHDPHYSISVTAPSNADALEVGKAIRAVRREGGQIAPSNAITVKATDQVGNTFDLPLAQGDRVRLFARTWGNFKGEDGRVRGSIVGDNGTVLTVHLIDVNSATGGLALRTGEGKVAFVPWDRLRQEGSGRIALTYGDCLTIDTAQGITSDDTIMAMPGGSRAVTLYKAHVGGSRNRRTAHVFTAEAAEMLEVQQRRPINAPKLDDADLRDAVWANVARNLARAPVKESALALLRETEKSARKARHVFAKGERKREAAEQGRKQASTARRRRVRRQQAEGAAPAIERLRKTMGLQTAALRRLADQVEPNPGPALRAMEERLEVEAQHLAPLVLLGGYGYGEAVDVLIRDELARPGQGGAIHNLLALEDAAGRVLVNAIEAAEAGVARAQQRDQVLAQVNTIAAENAILVVIGQQTQAQVRELVMELASRDANGVPQAEIEAAAYVAVARETGRMQAQWDAVRRGNTSGQDTDTPGRDTGTKVRTTRRSAGTNTVGSGSVTSGSGETAGGGRVKNGKGMSRTGPRRTL